MAWQTNGSETSYDGLDQLVKHAKIMSCFLYLVAIALQYSTKCERGKRDYVVDVVRKMSCSLVGCVKEDVDNILG
jgi:hypothetical protein